MAGVDSLLRMMLRHGADELRIGTDLAPKMLQRGAPVRLSIPPTDGETLKHLLGELWTPERESQIDAGGKLAFGYQMESGESFAVSLAGRPNGLDAVFKKDAPVRPKPLLSAAFLAPVPSGNAAGNAAAPPVPAPPTFGNAPPAPSANTFAPTAPAAPHARLSPSSVELLQRAVALGASDLHLAAGEPATVRIDGRLRQLHEIASDAVDALIADCANDCSAQLAAGRSGDLALDLDGVGRFRVNVYRTEGRLAAAVRVLPRSAPRLEDLHFPVALADLVQAPHGLVLVCGPTGSGKSATLAALAEEALRRRGGVLISLEDPIEYALRGEGLVRQRQIGRDVRDFATGLRDALREDPDVLLIGEMRDPESISLALTAAETGHLVLASLHSRSASASVERIIDSYPPERQQQIRVQLADSLRVVLAQRLLPRKSGSGRIPAVEILRNNTSVGSLIRDGKTTQLPNVISSSKKEGMLALERCLADLVRSGQLEREVAMAAANDLSTLTALLQG